MPEATGLHSGVVAEIVLDWPRLLGDRIPLHPMLQVTITGSHGVAGARIVAYDFRPAEEPRDQIASQS